MGQTGKTIASHTHDFDFKIIGIGEYIDPELGPRMYTEVVVDDDPPIKFLVGDVLTVQHTVEFTQEELSWEERIGRTIAKAIRDCAAARTG